MRLIGRGKLLSLLTSKPEEKKWVANWVNEIEYAQWKKPQEVFQQFPRAYSNTIDSFTFPLPCQKKGIHVLIAFKTGTALITSLVNI